MSKFSIALEAFDNCLSDTSDDHRVAFDSAIRARAIWEKKCRIGEKSVHRGIICRDKGKQKVAHFNDVILSLHVQLRNIADRVEYAFVLTDRVPRHLERLAARLSNRLERLELQRDCSIVELERLKKDHTQRLNDLRTLYCAIPRLPPAVSAAHSAWQIAESDYLADPLG